MLLSSSPGKPAVNWIATSRLIFMLMALLSSGCAWLQEELGLHNHDPGAQQAVPPTFASLDDVARFVIQASDRYDLYQQRLESENSSVDESDEKYSKEFSDVVITIGSSVTHPAVQVSTSTTNNQVSGVQEGALTAVSGDYLIILQDGSLYSSFLGTNADDINVAGRLNLFEDEDTWIWYDELVAYQNHVIVVAFDYDSDEQELSIVHVEADGSMQLDSVYRFSSYDYFSGRNYSLRMLNNRLIFNLQVPVDEIDGSEDEIREGLIHQRWKFSQDNDYRHSRMLSHDQIIGVASPEHGEVVIHSLFICDLNQLPTLECEIKGLTGSLNPVFYVSTNYAYLSTKHQPDVNNITDINQYISCANEFRADSLDQSVIYRVSLRTGHVDSALICGAPNDQFAFSEAGDELHILVTQQNKGFEIASSKQFGLQRWFGRKLFFTTLAADTFKAEGAQEISGRYVDLNTVRHYFLSIHNRYTDDYLIVAGSAGIEVFHPKLSFCEIKWCAPDYFEFSALPYHISFLPLRDPEAFVTLPTSEYVIRLEILAGSVLTAGGNFSDEDEYEANTNENSGMEINIYTLDDIPKLTDKLFLPNYFEAESRSQAFNLMPLASGDTLMGLPTYIEDDDRDLLTININYFLLTPYYQLFTAGELSTLIDLDSLDWLGFGGWYGATRPLFIDGRIFSLFPGELVEGALMGNEIIEASRIQLTRH